MNVNQAFARAFVFLLSLSLFGLLGCQKTGETPEETLTRFLNDVRTQHAQPAWRALTEENQTILKDRYLKSYLARNPTHADPSGILFSEFGLKSLGQPSAITVISPLGGPSVQLRVSIADHPSTDFKLYRTPEGWKVDLLAALKATP